MTIAGPTTTHALANVLHVAEDDVSMALQSLESEGAVLRGRFTPGDALSHARDAGDLEWCDRRLLARIHRYTLNRLRAEIEPVSPADFMRFLFAWQHVEASSRLTGIEGLRTVIGVLDGFELAAGAWERYVLPARLDRYEPSMLDMLCLSGEIGWARLSDAGANAVALFPREHGEAWQTLREASDDHNPSAIEETLSDDARQVLDVLRRRGASFRRELIAAAKIDDDGCRRALNELVAAGAIASDGFAGLRAMTQSAAAANTPRGRDTRDTRETRVDPAGRWSVLKGAQLRDDGRDAAHAADAAACEAAVERQAWALLRRYGVVFRRLLTREANARPWRELTRIYRRLEARGEIRGGRFVTGMSGEQFALPDAIERMREIRRSPAAGTLLVVSAADPLNLAGIVTSGDRVRAIATSRIVYRDGVPLAALEGDYVRPLAEIPPAIAGDIASALAGRRVPPIVSGYLGRTG
jgi:ATP-dependent Lhr-like helicase